MELITRVVLSRQYYQRDIHDERETKEKPDRKRDWRKSSCSGYAWRENEVKSERGMAGLGQQNEDNWPSDTEITEVRKNMEHIKSKRVREGEGVYIPQNIC